MISARYMPAGCGADGQGLAGDEVRRRLSEYGDNTLPQEKPSSLFILFLRQFLSPLIYILLFAGAVSFVIGDEMDAIFIGIVLLVNSMIGAAQEYSAGLSAAKLRGLEVPLALVIRDGEEQEIAARMLVPGDLVLLEAGMKVPADIRLIQDYGLLVDESALTGESIAVEKHAEQPSTAEATIQEQHNCVFAGTVVTRGRGRGIVTHTGLRTEIGKIAVQIQGRTESKPPLLIRMEKFAGRLAGVTVICIAGLALMGLARGLEWHTLFMASVGLAVSAIPEGLPIAITVALAIGARRMAGRNVITRHMTAVESLGSCTMIATDKTGTLTLNALSVTDIILPDGACFSCMAGHTLIDGHISPSPQAPGLRTLLRAAILANEGLLVREDENWKGIGDTVDIALLAAAHKGGLKQGHETECYPEVGRIPYEPELKYAASFHRCGHETIAFVKGAPETLLAMSTMMQNSDGDTAPIRHVATLEQKELLAEQGLRVLAFAMGRVRTPSDGIYTHRDLENLVFLGLVGMKDPVRPEVPEAIAACRRAGIGVVMITGDDPKTAAAIARNAGLNAGPVILGTDLREKEEAGQEALDTLVADAAIFARVEPAQKLMIVRSLARAGHFVAVTGDGVNDAPALRHAHVGVAMGGKGTDIARESAGIILTDDNFASIVEGIREGRIVYANIRKVVFLLVSTGAAEVVLFFLAMIFGMPIPLLAVQLLWLNLVTESIQHVALASERAEGGEMEAPPRRPNEPIFDRLMIWRIALSAIIMGVTGFVLFRWLLLQGHEVEYARNMLLLLMVLFENFQTFNSRSERRSVFHRPLEVSRLLVLGVIAAQLLHIVAMYLPGLSDTLRIAPVSLQDWMILLGLASLLMVVMEVEKRCSPFSSRTIKV